MIDEIESGLYHFYSVLSENVKKSNLQWRENSVFITLIGASQNNVLRLLSDSSLSSDLIGEDYLNELINQNLVKRNEFSGKYSITAQGVWLIEKNKKIVSEPLLIEYFQKNQFQRKIGTKIELKFREKVLLLSMIASRTFSKESAVDLTSQKKLEDSWKEIFDLSNQFLFELGVITEDERDKLYTRSKNDPPVRYIFRRNTDFPKKTNLILKFDKGLTYWLEIPETENEFKDTIAFLFSTIFGHKLTFQNFDSIYGFCNKISHNYSIFVFPDIKKHIYVELKYDSWLKEALIKGIKEYS